MRPPSYVYVVTNRKQGTLYVGATTDLLARIWQHKSGVVDGFTKKYGLDRLVYFEAFEDIQMAVQRERQIKKWKRAWKIGIIEEKNPEWHDLYLAISSL